MLLVDTPCKDCKNVGENWICLTCQYVACSYYVNKHMQVHHDATKHPITLSFSDLSFWCYLCQSYIRSQALNDIYMMFQAKKFTGTTTMAELEKAMNLVGAVQLPAGEEEKSHFTLESIAEDIKQGKTKRIAVLTGAGISVAAGIPDFRSPDSGLYSQMTKYNLPYPEAVFSIDYFLKDPEPFYTIAKGMWGEYLPTKVHYFIRMLQDKGILMRNYTQNVDNLEIDAGVNADLLVQAHGSIQTSRCASCKLEVDKKLMTEHLKSGVILRCKACNGPCKPDFVFFGEALPIRFSILYQEVANADLIIVMGTSLKVFPFSTLVELASSTTPILIMNKEEPEKLAKKEDKRNVLFLGNCEENIEKLVNLCGMQAEFIKLLKEREKRSIELKKK